MSTTETVFNFQNLNISDNNDKQLDDNEEFEIDDSDDNSNVSVDGASTDKIHKVATQQCSKSVKVNAESSEIEINGDIQIISGLPNSKQASLAKEVIENVFGNSVCSFGDVTVQESEHVRVGNTTQVNIHGPININYNVKKVQYRREFKQSIFMDAPPTVPSDKLIIVSRREWLAQPPFEIDLRQKRADLVIICHTATEASYRQAGNILLVRTMQTYHIESKEWDDIAYNFMVGCDGQVYEGRGWKNIGAHTKGHNVNSIGIAFIGTFMRLVPPDIALNACKKLIDHGIAIGEIDPNYKLIGHCQARPTESPGKKLFEIIKTWPHWTSEFEPDY